MKLVDDSEDFLDEATAKRLVAVAMPCSSDALIWSRSRPGHGDIEKERERGIRSETVAMASQAVGQSEGDACAASGESSSCWL